MMTARQERQNEIGELAIAVFRVSAHMVETGNAMVKDLGITAAWWQVLGAMGRAPSPLSVSEIARDMGLMRQSVQRIVDVMENRGFVSFKSNPRHKRAKLVVFTAQGQAAIDAALKRQGPWAATLVEALGADRVRDAAAFMLDLDRLLVERLGNPEAGDKD